MQDSTNVLAMKTIVLGLLFPTAKQSDVKPENWSIEDLHTQVEQRLDGMKLIIGREMINDMKLGDNSKFAKMQEMFKDKPMLGFPSDFEDLFKVINEVVHETDTPQENSVDDRCDVAEELPELNYNVKRAEDGYNIYVPAAGHTKSSVNIEVLDNTIVISTITNDDSEEYIQQAFLTNFSGYIPIPEDVEEIKASMENGMITIHVKEKQKEKVAVRWA